MEILQISAVALVTLSLALLLKKDKPEMALAVGMAGGLIVLIAAAAPLAQLIGQIRELTEKYNAAQLLLPVIKTVVIAYVAEFTAELCREGGETFLATKVELAGKIFMLMTALPFIVALAGRLIGLIEDTL